MCNLYSITTSQDAIRRLFGVATDSAGNLPSMPGVFPDYPAPIVRNAGAEREMVMMRWGNRHRHAPAASLLRISATQPRRTGAAG
jgi:putative SOS response-associated peptidase YedK